jgi:hypothetical protein
LHTLIAQTATSLVIGKRHDRNWLWLEIGCGHATLSVCSRETISRNSR